MHRAEATADRNLATWRKSYRRSFWSPVWSNMFMLGPLFAYLTPTMIAIPYETVMTHHFNLLGDLDAVLDRWFPWSVLFDGACPLVRLRPDHCSPRAIDKPGKIDLSKPRRQSER